MPLKDTVSKIAKGVGDASKTIKKSVIENADNLKGSKTYEKFKHYSEKYLEDIPLDAKYTSMLYQVYPKRIKTKYAVGGVALITGATLVGKSNDMRYKARLGPIEAGGLSHMTSQAISPLTQELQQGSYDAVNIMHKARRLPYRESGAEGDIVFAMHNMR